MGGGYANGTHRRRQGRKHNWQADAADASDICHEGRAMQIQLHSNTLSTAEFFVFALAEVCFQLRQSGLRLKALKGH